MEDYIPADDRNLKPCEEEELNEMVGVDGYSEHIIGFPSGNDEETEYDQEALTVGAFTLKIALPDGCSVSLF